jgi:hypothetical protein
VVFCMIRNRGDADTTGPATSEMAKTI